MKSRSIAVLLTLLACQRTGASPAATERTGGSGRLAVGVAVDDAFDTPSGVPLTVSFPGVLANDSTAPGESAVLVSPPASGQLTLDPSGGFVYTPAAGFSGPDRFTYTLSDGVTTGNVATVDIEVVSARVVPQAARVSRTYVVESGLPALIPRAVWFMGGEASGMLCSSPPLQLRVQVPDDLLIESVSLRVAGVTPEVGLLGIAITRPGLRPAIALQARLGQPGSAARVAGVYEFDDTAAETLWPAAAAAGSGLLPPGRYRGSDFAGNGSSLTEPDQSSAGTWTIDITEYCHAGEQGRIDDVALTVTGLRYARTQATPSTLGAIPDAAAFGTPGPPRDVRFDVPPGRGTVIGAVVSIGISHNDQRDLAVRLIAPDGSTHLLFDDYYDNGGPIDGTLTFSDRARDIFWGSWPTDRTLRTTRQGTQFLNGVPTVMDRAFAGNSAQGTWTLRVTDDSPGVTGSVRSASLVLLTSAPPPPAAPEALRVTDVAGTRVFLQWSPPTLGPAPTSYVLKAGVAAGETLVALPTGDATPAFTVTAPPGIFHARVHAITGGVESAASNEVRLVVGVPAPPSAPEQLAGTVNGDAISLSWRNTRSGGRPEELALDVTGAYTGTVSLPAIETISVGGVAAGSYTLAVRAVNPAGSSPASNGVTLAVPGPCTGVPGIPSNFVAFTKAGVATVRWDPPAAGPSVSSYLLRVTGAFTGDIPLATRDIAGVVPSGTYALSVSAQNACGTGRFTATQIVVVP